VAGHGLRKDTPVRVLSWNLFHGRSLPETRRPLLHEFCGALDGWEWDVALLQEVPPWWPPLLARATGAPWARTALTSRNQLLCARRAVASRRPDLARSNGGGANAILVRADAGVVVDHRRHRLTLRPERRVAHAVALRGTALTDGVLWVGNLHASQADPLDRARADGARAEDWLLGLPGAGDAIVLGGDFNDREPPPGRPLRPVASRSVDHVQVGAALTAAGEATVLRRARRVDGEMRRLSDHPPLLVELQHAPRGGLSPARDEPKGRMRP